MVFFLIPFLANCSPVHGVVSFSPAANLNFYEIVSLRRAEDDLRPSACVFYIFPFFSSPALVRLSTATFSSSSDSFDPFLFRDRQSRVVREMHRSTLPLIQRVRRPPFNVRSFFFRRPYGARSISAPLHRPSFSQPPCRR